MGSDNFNRFQRQVEQKLRGGVSASQSAPQARTPSQKLMVAQLRAILDNASVGIAITRNSRFELLGQHACRMFGYAEAEFLGCSTRMIFSSDEVYAEFGARVRAAFIDHGHFDGEQIVRRRDGSDFWAHMLARGVVAGDPTGGTIWIMEDISDARAARDKLSWTATHDSLTQLVNRREFESRLAQSMTQFKGGNLCVMFIDLDRFKAVNDNAGHACGDEVLRQISRLMEAQVRASDSVSRLGGDEFAVLLPGCSLARAQQLAEQIRAAVDSWRLRQNGQEYSVGASIGVAAVTSELPDIVSVLSAADGACYQAKHAGRNCVATYASAQATAP